MQTIREVLSETLGYDITPHVTPRSYHIIRTYQKLCNKLRPGDDIKRRLYIERCLADLAGANGSKDHQQRTEIRL